MWDSTISRRGLCRRMRLTFGGVLLLTLAVVGDGAHAAPGARWQSPFAERRARFVAAESGKEKGAAAQRLLARASPQDLQRLRFDEDESVALSAAWRQVEIQMAAQFAGPDRGASIVYLPPEVTRDFLGFVEGRLRVPAPDRWVQRLLSARYTRWGTPLFASVKIEDDFLPEGAFGDLLRRVGEDRPGLPKIVLSLDGKSPRAVFEAPVGDLHLGQQATAYLPDEVAERLKEERDFDELDPEVTGIAGPDRALLALPAGIACDEEVICLKTRGSKVAPEVLWRRTMDSSWSDASIGHNVTEFRMKGELVYLFHCSETSIGIECISLVDGSRQFSFNSQLPQR